MPIHEHPLTELNIPDTSKNYPASFKAYHCGICDRDYEWWQLPAEGDTPFYAGGSTEPIEIIARAKALESFPHEQIWLNELHRRLQTSRPDATIEQASNMLNKIYDVFNKKGIKMVRCRGTPQQYEREFDEKFQCIEFAGNTKFADLLNKRVIRQWDFKYVGRIDAIRERVNQDDDIRFKERWLAAIDFFRV